MIFSILFTNEFINIFSRYLLWFFFSNGKLRKNCFGSGRNLCPGQTEKNSWTELVKKSDEVKNLIEKICLPRPFLNRSTQSAHYELTNFLKLFTLKTKKRITQFLAVYIVLRRWHYYLPSFRKLLTPLSNVVWINLKE